MHDLLRQMAWDIVREKSNDPNEWSRLWFKDDVCDVFIKDKGTEAVEGVSLNLGGQKLQIHGKVFARMSNLRLLKISGDLEFFKGGMWNFSGSLEYLSNELRWLHWHGYPFKFLPSAFYPENLVALDMSYGHLKQLWTGSKSFEKLESIKLSHCCNFTKTPDFTCIRNLEELILEDCTNLVEVHPSVGKLTKLLVLNLKSCKNLKNFPSIFESGPLQILNLSGCSKLEKLPEDLGKVINLVQLHLEWTAIKELPSSISFLTNLEVLSLGQYDGIQYESSLISWPFSLGRKRRHTLAFELPSLSGLLSLRNLSVSRCKLQEASLDVIGSLSLLEKLNLSGNDFSSLPSNFSQLSRLQYLGLVGCRNIQALPELPCDLRYIDADDCTSLRELPKLSLFNGDYLGFRFGGCSKLDENKSLEIFADSLSEDSDTHRTSFDMLVPRSRIPEWFSNRSMGNCVKLDLPRYWHYKKLIKGLAFSVILHPINSEPTMLSRPAPFTLDLSFGRDNMVGSEFIYRDSLFSGEPRLLESDHIWLGYLPKNKAVDGGEDFNEVSFKIFHCRSGNEVKEFVVKECGVSLLGEEVRQEEGSNSSMIQWFAPPPEDDGDGVFYPNPGVESGDIEDEPPVKKSRTG